MTLGGEEFLKTKCTKSFKNKVFFGSTKGSMYISNRAVIDWEKIFAIPEVKKELVIRIYE